MERNNVVILNDDDGNEAECGFLDLRPNREKEYVVLQETWIIGHVNAYRPV